jgi:pimeloyl-[acyl-carrier protein] methyl ester esterase
MVAMPAQGGSPRHCRDLGQGRPLVLLHGWCMSAAVWEPLHPLAGSCRLLLPDLRGHGSAPAAPAFGLEELVADVAALFRELDLRDAVLGGWSMGALAALAAMPLLRERLAGLVLLGGTARFTETEGYPHGLPDRELWGMSARLRRDYSGTLERFVRGMFADGELSPEAVDRIVHRLLAGAPPRESALSGLQVLAAADLRPVLETLDRPALILHGEEDRVCPPAGAAYLAAQLHRARLVMVSGVGHAPFLSRPELVLREVVTFLGGLS